MVYCPYSDMNNECRQEKMNNSNSYVRILQASPNTPAVDVYANDTLIAQNLTYKSFSPYSTFPSGNYNMKVYYTGQKTNPLIDAKVFIPPGNVFNIAIIGLLPNISFYGIPEPNGPQNFGRPCIRFINLSPTEQALDLTVNGVKIFSNINYKDYTMYACIPAGEYTFRVYAAGTENLLSTISNAQLEANKYYSIYALGVSPLETMLISEPR
ncbi:DUF4397 domain-containing protein [Clostridium thailandense]|uniref:DUF4397 domain-containing protein n=1 Tax=Clostridium thailandense TaxID=2794346 RepID=UPI0039897175